jgi:hypothetical protein
MEKQVPALLFFQCAAAFLEPAAPPADRDFFVAKEASKPYSGKRLSSTTAQVAARRFPK